MKQKNWFKPKAFTHLTKKLGRTDGMWIKNYVSNPVNIERHRFFPLIHRTIIIKRFKESKDINGVTVKKHHTFKNGVRVSNVKYREIYYPNHLDSHIYSFYTQKILEPLYEERLRENPKLSEAILAYRRISMPNGLRCKCNIDFANEVFDEIKKTEGEYAVLALDISKFFDSLDPKKLKQSWARLLGRADLPKDHYNIYKSLTQFSFVEMKDLLSEFGYKHPNQLIQKDVTCFVETGVEFRDRIKSKGLVKKNPFRRVDEHDLNKKSIVGIPQGTPISAFLANLYLLEFDKKVISLIGDDGVYRRYSDDILIICPKASYLQIEKQIYDLINCCKLVIQPLKTQRSFFIDGKLAKGEKPLLYLGFQFDGYRKLIKSASLSKFYRKMKTAVKFRAYRAFLARQKREKGILVDATLHRKKLYNQFSYLGAAKTSLKKRNYFSYSSFAAEIMNSQHINKQLSKAWGILHAEIKKREKMYGLPKMKKYEENNS